MLRFRLLTVREKNSNYKWSEKNIAGFCKAVEKIESLMVFHGSQIMMGTQLLRHFLRSTLPYSPLYNTFHTDIPTTLNGACILPPHLAHNWTIGFAIDQMDSDLIWSIWSESEASSRRPVLPWKYCRPDILNSWYCMHRKVFSLRCPCLVTSVTVVE